jgi:hypothetical protein
MPNELKRVQGVSTIAGTVIYTVPATGTVTLIGLRCSNNTAGTEALTVRINTIDLIAPGLPVPAGSAFDAVSGQKIIAATGDTITVSSLADNSFGVHLSFLLQTPDA